MHNLLHRLARRHALFIALSALLLGGFQFLMSTIVSTLDLSAALPQILKSVPPFLRIVLEEQLLGGATTRGMLAFGWNHPITQALGTAAAIVLATRAVAGEIESGTLELVLSQPISRLRYMTGQILFSIFALLLLTLTGVLGTFIGQQVYGLEMFSTRSFFHLAVSYTVLQLAWFGITLLISVHAREAGRVALAAFLLALLSYLIQAVGTLWPDAAFLLPYSLHTYYSPRSILVENSEKFVSIVILCGVFVVTAVAAGWRFHRRDIP